MTRQAMSPTPRRQPQKQCPDCATWNDADRTRCISCNAALGTTSLALLKIPETAEALGCSPDHVYRLIASGELRAVDIATAASGRPKTRVRTDDLAAYINARTRTTSSSRRVPSRPTRVRA